MQYDYCIIGGGIVGLATAYSLLRRRPGAGLIVIEKEEQFGTHQTGRNSGVIHSGIYYAPGSLKARLCRAGANATKLFCKENDIEFESCGKLLVATNSPEHERMMALLERSKKNGVAADRLSSKELKEIEPHIEGVGALLVPETGIVDYKKICAALALKIEQAGGVLMLSTAARSIKEHGAFVEINLEGANISAKRLVACAGLQGDRLAKSAGIAIDCQIIPFRGDYYRLPGAKSTMIRHLIYPIPNPELPFLGIHLTKMINGAITLGPNAVFGLAREGYDRSSINFSDAVQSLSFVGTWKVLGRNWRSAAHELSSSICKRYYLRQCLKYCPSLRLGDLEPYPAGIRAQAVLRDGTLVQDFLLATSPRMVHVLNAPSPAATSALPIGEMIANKVLDERYDLELAEQSQ